MGTRTVDKNYLAISWDHTAVHIIDGLLEYIKVLGIKYDLYPLISDGADDYADGTKKVCIAMVETKYLGFPGPTAGLVIDKFGSANHDLVGKAGLRGCTGLKESVEEITAKNNPEILCMASYKEIPGVGLESITLEEALKIFGAWYFTKFLDPTIIAPGKERLYLKRYRAAERVRGEIVDFLNKNRSKKMRVLKLEELIASRIASRVKFDDEE